MKKRLLKFFNKKLNKTQLIITNIGFGVMFVFVSVLFLIYSISIGLTLMGILSIIVGALFGYIGFYRIKFFYKKYFKDKNFN